jgi:hypothetical protein
MEHLDSFSQHSRFNVWRINAECGFPKRLAELKFKVIVLHYSLFGYRPFLNPRFLNYLEASEDSYKIAFFQDEHRFCKMRFGFINRYKIDCVFTLVEPAFIKATYGKYTNVPKVICCLPGYVSDITIELARRFFVPDGKRTIDVGYRGRKLEYYMGKGAQEKYEIAARFKEKGSGIGLKLDIEAEEAKRIYGEKWYRFMANCRAVLGVEAGVSLFDVEDVIYEGYQKLIAENPKISFEEMSKKLNFQEWEDRIFYRTISPRHFEAAAFRVCQILFEGKYSGILEPSVHYIPLKKDFSNFDDVIKLFKNPFFRNKLTKNVYDDLIASRKFTYENFIQNSFDPVLLEAGLEPKIDSYVAKRVTQLLREDARYRQFYGTLKSFRHRQFLGRSQLVSILRPLEQRYSRWKEGRIAHLIR